jgi:hypothetical protein
MASSPGEGIPPSGVPAGGSEGSGAQEPAAERVAQQGERYGLLTLTRYVKRDGRALILFAREEPDSHG